MSIEPSGESLGAVGRQRTRPALVTPLALVLCTVGGACMLNLPDTPDRPDAGFDAGGTDAPVADVATIACPPDVSGFQLPPWHVPYPLHRNLCTADQARQIAECISDAANSGNGTPCTAFRANTANEPCYQCAVTSSLSANYGALIDDGAGLILQNVPGCVANLTGDTSNTGCGAKLEANGNCSDYACRSGCATEQQYYECIDTASAGPCSQYDSSCAERYIEQCVAGNTYRESLLKTISLFCQP